MNALTDGEVQEIQALAERNSERTQARLREDLPLVIVRSISAPMARGDATLSMVLAEYADRYRIASMHWSNSGAVRVVWERR